MVLDDRFDSEESRIETTISDAETRADEKYIVKLLAKKVYNVSATIVKTTPKVLLYDLPIGLTKLAAATMFQAIPMWPKHRERALKYLGISENAYLGAGTVLQAFGEIVAAGVLLHYGIKNNNWSAQYAALFLGADFLCKFTSGLPGAADNLDSSFAEKVILPGWGQGIGFIGGGFLYVVGYFAKEIYNVKREEYKQRVRKIAAKMQAHENQE